jgi:hypothetical protein
MTHFGCDYIYYNLFSYDINKILYNLFGYNIRRFILSKEFMEFEKILFISNSINSFDRINLLIL